ncbi:50S ribosomal protein L15 [Patescibacteria group bacterium]|nr:50S ribosomal protein L15 [Patescibacteria group bacterium]
MRIDEITASTKSHKQAQRVGRGDGSGRGKTSGRGTKGQKSRTGGSVPARFEGGQTPFSRRMPKRKGFRSISREKVRALNVGQLVALSENGKITIKALQASGKLPAKTTLKILGSGEISEKIEVEANRISASARTKIESAGGKVTIVE